MALSITVCATSRAPCPASCPICAINASCACGYSEAVSHSSSTSSGASDSSALGITSISTKRRTSAAGRGHEGHREEKLAQAVAEAARGCRGTGMGPMPARGGAPGQGGPLYRALYSQIALHAEYGGVVPELAAEAGLQVRDLGPGRRAARESGMENRESLAERKRRLKLSKPGAVRGAQAVGVIIAAAPAPRRRRCLANVIPALVLSLGIGAVPHLPAAMVSAPPSSC
ncbi:hypothetical protein NB693_24770 [Pantoea ananatis]|uniref:hypothetical protein n=1 Tax=Pantoea ananas TaxID=553 RepID=UPI002220E79E|nr:hypothetical protein [Pantoea ananatis]